MLVIIGLSGCASAPPVQPASLASRDDRSRTYCHLLARNSAEATRANRLCLDMEDAAAIRAHALSVGTDLDRECAKQATFEGPGEPFSWVVYVTCVDDSI